MPEGSMDDGVGRFRSLAQAFQVFQIASMRLGAGGSKRLCARIRPRQSKDLVACADEFLHDGEADESGSARNEYTHLYLSLNSFQLN